MTFQTRHLTSCLAALLAATAFGPTAYSQAQERSQEGQASSNVDLYFPTGEQSSSLLMIRAQAPGEVRVGQPFEYQLTVRNLTDNLTLEDVRINHDETGDVSIEGAQTQQQGQGQNQQGEARQARQRQGEQAQQRQRQQGQNQQGQRARRGNDGAVRIGELKPGETQTVRVRAIAESEGTAGVCFRVSYTPTVCLVTRFVKPDLEVTKAVPEVADICQPLRFRYTVSNPGSADVSDVVVTDELPEGLTLASGERTIRHDVGDLRAGETKEFTADIRATQLGQFSSRAVAKTSDDLEAQSKRPSTRIVAADLTASIEGPEVQYTDQPSTYRVTVRNQGDGPAIDTTLEVEIDDRTRLVRTSRTSLNSVAPEQDDDTLRWDIGRLEPGEETAVSFSVNLSQVPQGYGDRGADEQSGDAEALMLRHVAVASSLCAADDQPEEIRQRAAAQTVAEAEILTLPALLLALVDRNDQVPQGENVEYVVTVVNQGTGHDDDVEIVVTLPEGLEYVDAEGPTDANADGRKVSFGAVDTIAPGEELRWILTAKANTSGQVSTRADLDSSFLSTTAISVEPTTILGSGTSPRESAPGNTQPGNSSNTTKNNDNN
ncbi:CARDB domain-containing protein [Tautonia marina]|uniref:CARDB domain-containing protein n=1 Tax=Tautonia marina TaxID=2653855 RepID=UPI001261243B|nr:CARDB domain-containing protein [Tautonia marina]